MYFFFSHGAKIFLFALFVDHVFAIKVFLFFFFNFNFAFLFTNDVLLMSRSLSESALTVHTIKHDGKSQLL